MNSNYHGGPSSHETAGTSHTKANKRSNDNTDRVINKYGITIGREGHPTLTIHPGTWIYVCSCVPFGTEDVPPQNGPLSLHYMIHLEEHIALLDEIEAFGSNDLQTQWVLVQRSKKSGISFWVLLERDR